MTALYPKIYVATAGLGEVYHYTSLDAAASIVEDGRVRLSTLLGSAADASRGSAKPFFLSLTRSKVGGYHARSVGNYGVLLALDAEALRARASMSPVDYWGPEFRRHDQSVNEMEERLTSDRQYVPVPASAVKSVSVLLLGSTKRTDRLTGQTVEVPPEAERDARMAPAIRKLLISAKKRGIRAMVFDDPKLWMSQRPEKALPMAEALKRLKGLERPGYSRKSTNWLAPYVELYRAPARRNLSERAQRVLRNIRYDYSGEARRSLMADLHNMRTTEAAGKLSELAHKHGGVDGFLEFLKQRWDRLDAETASGDDDLYYVQPDGSYKKGGDRRSKGLRRDELPEGAELSAERPLDVEGYRVAKAQAEALQRETDRLSKLLRAHPRGPSGLTPDEVKFSPEYRKAKADYDAAHERLRRHNAAFLKRFAREYKADRLRPEYRAEQAAKRAAEEKASAKRKPSSALRALAPKFAKLAQAQYDAWQQDESGFDEEVGYGGICHLIADAVADAASDAGFTSCTVSSNYEVHVFAVVLTSDGVFEVDVPHRLYETGGGYVWSKRTGVKFDAGDVVVSRIDADGEMADDEFYARYQDS